MTIRNHPPATRSPALGVIALVMAFGIVGCGSTVPTATEQVLVSSPAPIVAAAADPSPAASVRSPAASSPTASASADPAVSPSAAPTAEPTRQAFKMNLYRKGDYVSQYTLEWCVGASLQMARNMTTGDDDTSRAMQQHLWEMAQARSSSPFGGANPRGWTAALNDLGIGPYQLVSIQDYDEALRVAATAIRETRRPVGLVMWRGRHAWVMSGFESIGDPAVHQDIEVTGVRVLDPLFPRDSKTWGSSPRPNSLVTPATLAKQFVVRDRGRVDLGVPPGYLLILPTGTTVGTSAD